MRAGPPLDAALCRDALPPSLERWRVVLAPGAERRTSASEWDGAVVLVEHGSLEVECVAGGHRTFVAGDLLALGWLPLARLRNPGLEAVGLLAVRRRSRPWGEPVVTVLAGPSA